MDLPVFDTSHRDSRISTILDLLKNLNNADSREIQNIVKVVQELKEYLVKSDKKAKDYEKRINAILETLLRFTVMDFGQKAELSELADDLDAISVGINTLAEELEVKIKEETLNSERLQEQNTKLERMNKELASFAYVSSHDLQEPLRKINTYISRIMEEETKNLPEQLRFYLERIHSSTQRMQKLIRDILEYSKLASADSHIEHVDLHALAQECKEDFEEALKEKNATFEFDKLCEIKIIPFQFKRLLNNLLSNSLKFVEPERPLKISMTSQIENGAYPDKLKLINNKDYCHIKYVDNGIGFSPEYNEKVFEVFQRLHSPSEYEGTGVGLAICKRIVENHGGAIAANGIPDKGVTFDIYLPS